MDFDSQTLIGDDRETDLSSVPLTARVLLIQSNPIGLDELPRLIACRDLEVIAMDDSDERLHELSALNIDAILIHSSSPHTNGFRALTDLKDDERTIDVPVLILSSETNTTIKVRALELGAMDYITKPCDIAELTARLRSAVRMRRMIQMLAQRAQIDGLTGLFNRAFFDYRLSQEVAEATRFGSKLSLIMCDLDKFKWVNDTFGHPFGDRVLETFARVLTSGRISDIACRYGGEEFAVILPRAGAAEAAGVAERFRETIAQMSWEAMPVRMNGQNNGAAGGGGLRGAAIAEPRDDSTAHDRGSTAPYHATHAMSSVHITASFGVADLDRVHELSVHALVCAADAALYEAKQLGRDRVCIAPAGK